MFDKNFIVLDIETTGFSRDNSSIILVGMIIKTKTNYYFKQIFCESLEEEKSLLIELKSILIANSNSFLITYNGHSFDIPYINARFKNFRIDYQITRANNFDIYRLIRKHKSKLKLKKYNLKSVEKLLNIEREDAISGKESVALYFEYIKSNSDIILDQILLHNYEDILYLIPLLEILKFFNYNEILEFYPKEISNGLFLIKAFIKKDFFYCTLYSVNMQNLSHYDEYYSIESLDDFINIKMNIKKISLNNDIYKLLNYKILFNSPWEELSSSDKNKLILSVNNEIYYSNLVSILKKIFNIY